MTLTQPFSPLFASASREIARATPWRRRAFLPLAFLLAVVAVPFAHATTYRDRVLSSSPDFYWTLDDSDASQPASNLGSRTVSATFQDVTLGADGLVPDIAGGKAIQFNAATAKIAIPDAAEINNAVHVDRTIELWFKADDVSSSTEQVLWEEGGRSRGVNLYIREGSLYYGAWNQPNDDAGISSPWVSGENDPPGGFLFLSTPIDSNTAHHAALVLKGDSTGKTGTLSAYLDGNLVGQKTGVGTLFGHGDDIALGNTAQNTYFDNTLGVTTSNPFAGVIDEVALFNRAISHDGIKIQLGASFTAGDFNGDGKVNLDDYGILVSNLNKPGEFAQGDETLDGKIDLADFVAFRQAFAQPGAAVPEPNGLALLALGSLGLGLTVLLRKRRTAGTALAVALTLAGGAAVRADNVEWITTPSGKWSDGANWKTGGVPTTNTDDVAIIGNGGTAVIDAAVPNVLELRVNNGQLDINAGRSLGTDGAAVVATAGKLNLLGNSELDIGTNISVSGILALSPTAKVQSADTLGLSGTLQLGISGAQASHLAATGAANLSGSLLVDLPAADAVAGKSWDILQAGSITGKFASVAPLDAGVLPLGLELHTSITGGAAKLEVGNVPVLFVDRVSGSAKIENVIGSAIDFKGYQISSPGGLLKPEVFAGFGATNPQWVEANPNSKSLAELNLAGSTSLAVGNSLDLGAVYKAGNIAPKDEDLSFTYGGPDGVVHQGVVHYLGAPNDLTLNIDPQTGDAVLSNLSPFIQPANITGYSILSAGGGLNPAGWNGFAESGKAGAGWTEAPGRSDALAEVNLQNSFTYSQGKYVDLGQIYTPGAKHDLTFEYSTLDGQILTGTIVYSAFQPIAPALPGDANADGKVDLTDFGILKSNFGSGTSAGQGDFNGDAKVDLTDFGILKSNFGKSGVAAVPEPSTAVLLLLGLAGGAVRFRRRAVRVLSLLAVASTTLVGQARAGWLDEVLSDQPFALFRFDDPQGSDTVGDSADAPSLVATYSGGVTLGAKGLVTGDPNAATLFDGVDGAVAVADSALVNTGGPFTSRTVELWFQATDATTATPQVLFEEGGTSRGLNLYIQGGKLYAGGWNTPADDGGLSTPWLAGAGDPAGSVFVSTPIESGKAYHAALTYEGDATGKGGTIRGFLDGVAFGAKGGVGRLFAHTADIGIGAKRGDALYQTGGSTGTGDYFKGTIDDVALYTDALSPLRIAAHLGVSVTPGDFNADGKVDLSDFGILRDNFSTGTTFAQGDDTLDGKVDLADFFAFAAEFGAPGAAAVPEPSTWLLALAAAAGLALVRRPRAGRHEGNQ